MYPEERNYIKFYIPNKKIKMVDIIVNSINESVHANRFYSYEYVT